MKRILPLSVVLVLLLLSPPPALSGFVLDPNTGTYFNTDPSAQQKPMTPK